MQVDYAYLYDILDVIDVYYIIYTDIYICLYMHMIKINDLDSGCALMCSPSLHLDSTMFAMYE